ncbi:MAG: protein translocase subunit SecD [Thermosynechococcaceae cyanobacterium]
MIGKQRFLLAFILLLMVAALVVITQIPTRLGLDLRGGSQLTLQVKTTDKVKEITPKILEGVQRVVEGRINGLGVSEAVVQTSGQSQLLVQLPGVNDPQQAERVLGGTAQLEFRKQKKGTEKLFRAVLEEEAGLKAQKATLDQTKDTKGLEAIQDKLKKNQQAIAALYEPSQLNGSNLTDAFAQPVSVDSKNWAIIVKFDGKGGELFADLTKEIAGAGRSLGIFLDDRLISYPGVDVRYAATGITGGSAEISGNFDAQGANDLAVQLRGGALPVPVEIIENRTVGATLGKDSIRSSIVAGLAGLFLVFVFMAVYYRLPGVIADIALGVYALLTYASFVLLGVTLTLPGIAGFILSIGMAVDANVLIFERTREELRAGKTLYRSIESGFNRAFSSILDSNVTTLIACAALFWLGSGFVKGFALTLALGVLISMFTALTCSRTLLFMAISAPQLRKMQFYYPLKTKVAQ